MCDSSPTWFDMIILLVSDSMNYNAAFFLNFKQLPPAKTVEILSGLLTESEKRKNWRHTWITGRLVSPPWVSEG